MWGYVCVQYSVSWTYCLFLYQCHIVCYPFDSSWGWSVSVHRFCSSPLMLFWPVRVFDFSMVMFKSFFFQYPLQGCSLQTPWWAVLILSMWGKLSWGPAPHDSVADVFKSLTPDHLFQAYLSTVQFRKRFPGDNSKKVYNKAQGMIIDTLCKMHATSFIKIGSIDWLHMTC